MLQEDSNGESSFEFVEKKGKDTEPPSTGSATSLSSISPDFSGTGNILSNVKPPVGLPDFSIWTPAKTDSSVVSTAPLQSGVVPPPPLHQLPPVNVQSPIKQTFQSNQPLPQAITQPLMYSIPQSSVSLQQPVFTSSQGITPAVPPLAQSFPASGVINPPSVDVQLSQVDYSNEHSSNGFMNMVKGAFSGKGVLSRMAEKAKNSVDSIITTLDPQMSEYIYSGGDLEVTVTSRNEEEVGAIREAFHFVLGKAWVNGVDLSIPQKQTLTVGLDAGFLTAEEKIDYSLKYRNTPTIAIENVIFQQNTNWFYLDVLVFKDVEKQITLRTFSQAIPIPVEDFLKILERERPNYDLFSVEEKLSFYFQIHPNWQMEYAGLTRKEALATSAKILAKLYKNKL